MEALKELIGLDMTTFGVTVKLGWMMLWPLIVIELGIHLRCLKSFKRKKTA